MKEQDRQTRVTGPTRPRITRWLVVVAMAVVLVLIPITARHLPVTESSLSGPQLVRLIQGSQAHPWSGFVRSSGALQVPDSDSFANLATLLGEDNNLRVWWRSDDDWRVDRIRSTGETNLFRRSDTSVRWVFESETATITPVSTIRLPDASDLLPPTLGRAVVQGARRSEVSRLPAKRIAGISALGLRLVPKGGISTVARAELWADPESGLVLQVDLYGKGDRRPVLSTQLSDFDARTPDRTVTRFRAPIGVQVNFDQTVDDAAAANAYAPYDLPRSLGGLKSRDGENPGAVGIYGRGPTTLIVMPLRGQVAAPLRDRLRESGASKEISSGTLLPVGLVGVLVTRRGFATQGGRGGGTFLLAGTVDQQTLESAAKDLGATG